MTLKQLFFALTNLLLSLLLFQFNLLSESSIVLMIVYKVRCGFISVNVQYYLWNVIVQVLRHETAQVECKKSTLTLQVQRLIKYAFTATAADYIMQLCK